MKALAFPFHIDQRGRLATVTTYADIVRGQLIDVLMTNFMERTMRPRYGSDLRSALFGPVDDLVQSDAANTVVQRIGEWAPRVITESLIFEEDDQHPAHLFVNVKYRVGVFDQADQLRLPVTRFLTEESEI